MKWTEDVLRNIRTSSLLEQRGKDSLAEELQKTSKKKERTVKLTIKHLQGVYFLFFIGTSFAFVIFSLEVLQEIYNSKVRSTAHCLKSE